MILGIGADLVHLPRIARALDRHGARFVARILTQAETREFERRRALSTAPARSTIEVRYLALRFAAKEAAAKALGCGFRRGISLKDFSVSNTDDGAPELKLCGAAATHFSKRGGNRTFLSLSDDGEYAQAFVVLSKE